MEGEDETGGTEAAPKIKQKQTGLGSTASSHRLICIRQTITTFWWFPSSPHLQHNAFHSRTFWPTEHHSLYTSLPKVQLGKVRDSFVKLIIYANMSECLRTEREATTTLLKGYNIVRGTETRELLITVNKNQHYIHNILQSSSSTTSPSYIHLFLVFNLFTKYLQNAHTGITRSRLELGGVGGVGGGGAACVQSNGEDLGGKGITVCSIVKATQSVHSPEARVNSRIQPRKKRAHIYTAFPYHKPPNAVCTRTIHSYK